MRSFLAAGCREVVGLSIISGHTMYEICVSHEILFFNKRNFKLQMMYVNFLVISIFHVYNRLIYRIVLFIGTQVECLYYIYQIHWPKRARCTKSNQNFEYEWKNRPWFSSSTLFVALTNQEHLEQLFFLCEIPFSMSYE